jgi:predicted DNA-binding transcriptional regulator AlpA
MAGSAACSMPGLTMRATDNAKDSVEIISRFMPPKLINKREVAQLFGVSKNTIDRWLLAGKLPKPTKRFGSRRWEYDKLVALLKSKPK